MKWSFVVNYCKCQVGGNEYLDACVGGPTASSGMGIYKEFKHFFPCADDVFKIQLYRENGWPVHSRMIEHIRCSWTGAELYNQMERTT